MNKTNHPKFGCNDCCEVRFHWPRIKAIEISSIPPPPVVIPGGSIISTINRYFYIALVDIDVTTGSNHTSQCIYR